jgi:hypothetical protein
VNGPDDERRIGDPKGLSGVTTERLDADSIKEIASRGIQGPGRSLPYLKKIQEFFSHHDLSNVKAYIGGPARQAAERIGAAAYTMGESVAFRERPDLATAAHEATHVVQQWDGVNLAEGVGEVGDPYERAADRIARRQTRGSSEYVERELGRPNLQRISDSEVVQAQAAEVQEEEEQVVNFPGGAALPVVDGADGPGEEYFDPTGSGNPLLDTSEPYRGQNLSANFTVGEYAQSGGNAFDRARIDPDLVGLLQAIRDRLGEAVYINSGYRSFAYNTQLYNEPTESQHQGGRAADIRADGYTGRDLAREVLQTNCNVGLGVGANYVHVDVRGRWARWTYDPGPDLEWVDQLHAEVCE